ncbi:MAG: sulfur carrier protein ThiS [Pseudomonadota bacterium]
MRVQVNGDEHEVPAGTGLRALLDRLGVPRRFVAVEHNGELLEAEGDRTLVSGDRIEVVRFVGGG